MPGGEEAGAGEEDEDEAHTVLGVPDANVDDDGWFFLY
jgi:hypothetical protein